MRAPLLPYESLAALILLADPAVWPAYQAQRVAGLMTDNAHLVATILAAEQIIFGITCGHPFLLHHLGQSIAMAAEPLTGSDLAWHQKLYDVQQSVLCCRRNTRA